MARVTVEDCLENVKNRFELVMLASKRARQLMRGSSEPKVAWENDKATVVALREIAMGYTDFSDAHHADMMTSIPTFLSQPLENTGSSEPEITEPADLFTSAETTEEVTAETTVETTAETETTETMETASTETTESTEIAQEVATSEAPEAEAPVEQSDTSNPEQPTGTE